ncbi:MAG: hypothetical protein MHPSP_004293, partial [Paramarteilia canceri]
KYYLNLKNTHVILKALKANVESKINLNGGLWPSQFSQSTFSLFICLSLDRAIPREQIDKIIKQSVIS